MNSIFEADSVLVLSEKNINIELEEGEKNLEENAFLKANAIYFS